MGRGEIPLSRKHPTGSKTGTPGKKQQSTELVKTPPLTKIETVCDRNYNAPETSLRRSYGFAI